MPETGKDGACRLFEMLSVFRSERGGCFDCACLRLLDYIPFHSLFYSRRARPREVRPAVPQASAALTSCGSGCSSTGGRQEECLGASRTNPSANKSRIGVESWGLSAADTCQLVGSSHALLRGLPVDRTGPRAGHGACLWMGPGHVLSWGLPVDGTGARVVMGPACGWAGAHVVMGPA